MMIGTIMIYYIPFFYQAKGRTAEQSGIDVIPFMMAMVVGSGLSGWLNKVTGRYKPFMIIGPIIYGISGGLFFTIDQYTPNARIIGFQILLGFGAGLAFQQPCMYQPSVIVQAKALTPYSGLHPSGVRAHSGSHPTSLIRIDILPATRCSRWYFVSPLSSFLVRC